MAEHQRLQQVIGLPDQHARLQHRLALHLLLEPVARVLQRHDEPAQQRAVGLRLVGADAAAQLLVADAHRQLVAQLDQITREQPGGDPARPQQHVLGHLGRHIGVAVAVAAHP